MDSEGEMTGERSADLAQVGVDRVLFVGDVESFDDLASNLDGLDVVVETDAATARDRIADERFDCVLTAEDLPQAEALGLLGMAREADSECATVLIVVGLDESTEKAADAAGVTEVLPAGDGDGWLRAIAGLVRQATERVRECRQVDFYEGLLDGMDDFVVVFGADGEVNYVSPSIETITGVSPEAVFEAGPFGLVHPDDVPVIADAFWEMIAAPEGTTAKVATKARHADGTWRIHEAVATNRLTDPRIEGVVVNVRDVTDPPRPDAHHDEALSRLTDGFFALDADWCFTYINDPAAEMIGHPTDELLGGNLFEILPIAGEVPEFEEYRQTLEAGEPVAFDLPTADGDYYEIRAYPSETGVSVYVRDVTDQHEHDRKFRAIFERAIDAIVIADDEGRYVDANPAACDLFGLPRGELLGRSITDFAPEGYNSENVWQAFTENTHERGTFELVRPDSSERVVEYSASTDVLPNWHLSVMRDVTERNRFERELKARTERLRTIVENIPVVLFALDNTGTYTLSEGKGLAALESEPGEAAGTSIYDRYEDQPAVIEDFHRALDGERVHSTVEFQNAVFETSFQPVVGESGAVERVIGVSIDVTERAHHEHTLRALHESTRGLLGMDTQSAIAEHLVETAIDVLDFPGVVVYCFDESENVLRPTATSDGTDILGEPPVLGGDEPSITWQTFVTGNKEVLDDIRTSRYVYDDETTFRSGLYVPLGAHGVLVIGSSDVGAFDDRTCGLADLLAATGEAALDRVDQESALRERDQKLQSQNRQLRRLNRVNEIIREIDTTLVQADNRSEIEQAVTQQLTETDRFALAWIGEVDPDGKRLRPRAWSGIERGYLDTVVDDDGEPAARAAHDSEVTVVENVAAELRTEPWRTEALARNYQSALAVPLVHDGFSYGVLAVYATRPWAFDATTQSVLGQLGGTIAYAIDAVERKHALLSDDVTELEFSITDDNYLFNRLARQADCRICLEGFHTRETGVMAFVTVADVAFEQFVAVATESTMVEDVSIIRVDEESALVELHLPVEPLATGLADRGVVLADLESDPSGSRAIMVAPSTVDARSVVETIETMFPDSEFLARRERSRPPGGERETRQRLLGRLTDRQREVLQTAYHGGYFESPRTTTGEDLATALGVSSPAFHGHLRSLQRKLFASLLEADTEGLTD